MTAEERPRWVTGRRKGGMLARPCAPILLFAAAVLLSAGCGEKGAHAPGTPERPPVTGVEIVEAGSRLREKLAEAVGTVRARNIAAVAPQVMGRITSLPATEGMRVEKDSLLATIDDTQVRAQLAAAEGAVAEAEAEREEVERAISQAEANKALAEKTFERFRRLSEEKVVTQQEFDEAEARRTVARKEYERAQDRRAQVTAKIAQAKAQADAVMVIHSYTRVTAPFTGIVTEKKADAGTMAVPGSPILVLEDTGRYRIEASVPETYLGVLRPGSKVRVVLDATPGKEIPATVSEVVPLVDPASRTFIAKADLPGSSGMRTGMFGRILFPTGKETILSVSQRAIVRVGGSDGLYTVTADNVARLVMVRTGRSFGDDVEILSGIDPGTRVAVSPVDRLADGVRVEVRK